MKYISILLVLILFGHFGKAQEEPSALRISLITCTPGAELYSVFGHNALRIVDSAAGTDIAYNFGTFNFDDPDFYTKFVRGKLQYYLSQENFNDFLYAYQYFKRGVSEQVLNLTEKEKKEIQRALFENLTEENRYYKYDFFYDNCSTRLRDIIFKTKSNQAFNPPQFVANGLTFRDHLHTYLDRAEMKWTRLGIDLILGLKADRKMSVSNAMFLPEFLAKGVNATEVNGQKLVIEENTLLPDQQPTPTRDSFLLTPFFIFLIMNLYVDIREYLIMTLVFCGEYFKKMFYLRYRPLPGPTGYNIHDVKITSIVYDITCEYFIMTLSGCRECFTKIFFLNLWAPAGAHRRLCI